MILVRLIQKRRELWFWAVLILVRLVQICFMRVPILLLVLLDLSLINQ